MSERAMQQIAGPATPEAAIVAALKGRAIVLVGMMGAGKSSIGRRLAQRLDIPFVDADGEIEIAAGMSIEDIFATRGEPEFRSGEARVIARLLEGGTQVVATGGGAFMNADTRAAIKAKGISVWLQAGEPIVVKVALGTRSYDIVIGRGVLNSLGQRVAALRPGAKVAIVSDE